MKATQNTYLFTIKVFKDGNRIKCVHKKDESKTAFQKKFPFSLQKSTL